MTGIPEHNYPLFNETAARLRGLGLKVINPVEINQNTGRSWEECLRHDIPQLLRCRGIYRLPGWSKSRGATLENHIATELNFIIEDAS